MEALEYFVPLEKPQEELYSFFYDLSFIAAIPSRPFAIRSTTGTGSAIKASSFLPDALSKTNANHSGGIL